MKATRLATVMATCFWLGGCGPALLDGDYKVVLEADESSGCPWGYDGLMGQEEKHTWEIINTSGDDWELKMDKVPSDGFFQLVEGIELDGTEVDGAFDFDGKESFPEMDELVFEVEVKLDAIDDVSFEGDLTTTFEDDFAFEDPCKVDWKVEGD